MGAQTRNLTGMSDFLSGTWAATVRACQATLREAGRHTWTAKAPEASQLRGDGQLMATQPDRPRAAGGPVQTRGNSRWLCEGHPSPSNGYAFVRFLLGCDRQTATI